MNNQYASAYTPTYPQPQYSHHSPYPSYSENQGNGQQPSGGGGTPTYLQAPPPKASLQPEVPDILSQLVSAGLLPAGRQGLSLSGVQRAEQKLEPAAPPLAFNLSKAKVFLPSCRSILLRAPCRPSMPVCIMLILLSLFYVHADSVLQEGDYAYAFLPSNSHPSICCHDCIPFRELVMEKASPVRDVHLLGDVTLHVLLLALTYCRWPVVHHVKILEMPHPSYPSSLKHMSVKTL